jgi:NADPH-dependent glutamate synthase beta subunit-like oxidoreductase
VWGWARLGGWGFRGDEHRDVIDALEFIARYKTAAIRRRWRQSVAVIGAGNTAIDAANAARRLGAENVHDFVSAQRAAYVGVCV